MTCFMCHGTGQDPHPSLPNLKRKRVGRSGNNQSAPGQLLVLAAVGVGIWIYMKTTPTMRDGYVDDALGAVGAFFSFLFFYIILPLVGLFFVVVAWFSGGRSIGGTVRYVINTVIYALLGGVLWLGFIDLLELWGGIVTPQILVLIGGFIVVFIWTVAMVAWLSGSFGPFGRALDVFALGKARLRRHVICEVMPLTRYKGPQRMTAAHWNSGFGRLFFRRQIEMLALAARPKWPEEKRNAWVKTTLVKLVQASGVRPKLLRPLTVESAEFAAAELRADFFVARYHNERRLTFNEQRKTDFEALDRLVKGWDEAQVDGGTGQAYGVLMRRALWDGYLMQAPEEAPEETQETAQETTPETAQQDG
ncbi:hypothetical protein U5922_006090 [Aquicoccus sp. G2-2]|uniref:hypothetical protein n=1 Tax=Aquicoccus sp. G2-2 TaxID=3092120 RepID=UPI002ADF3E31|nr:hypothetical protein [Aquicoccus sp. G2-2]MEA1113060.1 hypothetical protein [Aquicoccus sp. G2-2]